MVDYGRSFSEQKTYDEGYNDGYEEAKKVWRKPKRVFVAIYNAYREYHLSAAFVSGTAADNWVANQKYPEEYDIESVVVK